MKWSFSVKQRKYSLLGIAVMMIFLATVLLWSCGNDNQDEIYGQLALVHVEELLEELCEKIGPRIAGTQSEVEASEYIHNQFEDFGYDPITQPFSYENVETGIEGQSQNIIATLAGSGEKQIILGAHYDSADSGSGADDNSSGVSVVLELAELLGDETLEFSVVFILFGAEEVGINGSGFYADQMSDEEITNTIVMINLDSLIAGDKQYLYGSPGEKGRFRDYILSRAEKLKVEIVTQEGNDPDYPAGTTGDWSDHAPFEDLGIPYLYFESTNWDIGNMDGYTQVGGDFGSDGEIWHTEFDNINYINENFPDRIEERLNAFVTVINDFLTGDIPE